MNVRVETWQLIGTFWKLPLRVVWMTTLAEVRVGGGVNLTSKMRAAAEEKMRTVATVRGTVFWASYQQLEKVAVKFEGDPEDAVEWHPERNLEVKAGDGHVPEDFIRAYCQSPEAVIRDPDIMDWIWSTLRRFMLHWLLNEQKTVDLVFAELDAFCFRKNWMSATAKWEHEKRAKKHFAKGAFLNPNLQSMEERGIRNYLTDWPVSAFDKREKIARFTLEVTTTREWEKHVERLERERKRLASPVYTSWVTRVIKRQAQRAMEIYAKYLRETSHPAGFFVERSYFSSTSTFKGLKSGSRGLKAMEAPGPWDATVVMRVPLESGESAPVVPPDASVPEVRPLQP